MTIVHAAKLENLNSVFDEMKKEINKAGSFLILQNPGLTDFSLTHFIILLL